LRVYAPKSILYLRYRLFCSHLLLFFCVKGKICLKKTKRQLVHTSTCSPTYVYTCVLRTPHGIYVYYHYSTSGFLPGSPGASSRHPDSHPSTPHAVCVRLRTHTHTTHTHQPPVKNGVTLPSPNRIPHTGNKYQPQTSWKTPARPSSTYACNGV